MEAAPERRGMMCVETQMSPTMPRAKCVTSFATCWKLRTEVNSQLTTMYVKLNTQGGKRLLTRALKKTMEGKSGIIERWVKKHLLLYTGAKRHPFILSIRNGTIDRSSFRRWLGQDYIFVREFVPFTASVLIKASKRSDESNDLEVILGGMSSLKDEIEWFKQEATKWDVPLSNITVHKANVNYCRFLESLMLPEVEYAVAITALWAIEAVYQDSFAHCLEEGNKTPSEIQETCQRWGNESFGAYCQSLQKIANRCLDNASDDACAKAEVAFVSVLEHEIEFWNMSFAGGPERVA